MIGSIIGDVIGSVFEFNNIDNENFELFGPKSTFTDDSVLTVATADVILNGVDYGKWYLTYAQAYPGRGWGGAFLQMISTGQLLPYNSYGNGSAMRVSPIGWAFDSAEKVLAEAKRSAECSHNHEEGIKGAQATALAVFLARNGANKERIRSEISALGYDLSKDLKSFDRSFDETCPGTLPKCFAIFFETSSYEHAIRTSIARGGDVDTIACIVGGIAQAYYGMPPREMVEMAYQKMSPVMGYVTTDFTKRYVDKDFVEPIIERIQETYNLFGG